MQVRNTTGFVEGASVSGDEFALAHRIHAPSMRECGCIHYVEYYNVLPCFVHSCAQ